MAAQSEEACAAVVRAMPAEARSLLRWLLAVLARVVAQSEVNRMNVHACGTPRARQWGNCLPWPPLLLTPSLALVAAVVVGPNLYTPPASADPMTALRMSQKAVDFLKLALQWWIRVEDET